MNFPHMREESELPPFEINFVLNIGGIGDFIHWTTAIQYAIEKWPHLSGKVYSKFFFEELARLWFAPYAERFSVRGYQKFEEIQKAEKPQTAMRLRSPYDSITSVYHHSLSVGFATYAMEDSPPEKWLRLPEIRGDETPIEKFNLPKDYVVVTTEATSPVRKLPSSVINGITKWLLDRGITPVFLGKREISPTHSSGHSEGISTEGVLDLRERTNLTEAAVILSKARAVCGLDNGLLHLACCSEVPVLFAFTTADPRHRLVPRKGKTLVLVPPEDLKCRFCQSNLKFLHHDFRNCLYSDIKCCNLFTAEDFTSQLEKLL